MNSANGLAKNVEQKKKHWDMTEFFGYLCGDSATNRKQCTDERNKKRRMTKQVNQKQCKMPIFLNDNPKNDRQL